MGSHNKFNEAERGHGFHSKEKNKGDGCSPLRCCTCGGENHRKDFPSHKGGRPQIYNS